MEVNHLINPPLVKKSEIRKAILNFEDELLKYPNAYVGDSPICPLKHSFSDGIYVREIFIPAGTVVVGKLHKHDHPNFLMSGEVEVITEGEGKQKLVAPLSMISKKGTKRVVHALTDVVWITVHSNPTNTQDLNKLEDIVIAKTYKELDKKSLFDKFKQLFFNDK